MKSYLVKRRLYKGRGEYSDVGQTVKMMDHEAAPLLASGALEAQAEPKAEAPAETKGRTKK